MVATRTSYDAIAESYAEVFRSELDEAPLDRALLAGFAETVLRDHPDAEVLEVGSGPGTVTAYLHSLGLDVSGIDVSPGMVEVARRAHPAVGFEVGDMAALARPAAGLSGLVAWYSFIHVPGAQRQDVLGEFYRVLRPGGHLLLAFQVGDGTLHLAEAFGSDISLDFYRLQPDAVAGLLGRAGFELTARLVKAPETTSAASRIPQGFLMARKPG